MDAVVLAAGLGRRFGSQSDVIPKCLVSVGGTPLLVRSLRQLEEHGFDKVIVVIGHLSEMIRAAVHDNGLAPIVHFAENPGYPGTGTARSLCCASSQIATDHFLLLEADLLYSSQFLVQARLCARTATVFTASESGSGDEVFVLTGSDGSPIEIAKRVTAEGLRRLDVGSARLNGELAGISVLPRSFMACLEASAGRPGFEQRDYESFIVEFSRYTAVEVRWLRGLPWTEVDNLADLNRARHVVWPRIVQEEAATELQRREMFR